jgi:hypothetical protein
MPMPMPRRRRSRGEPPPVGYAALRSSDGVGGSPGRRCHCWRSAGTTCFAATPSPTDRIAVPRCRSRPPATRTSASSSWPSARCSSCSSPWTCRSSSCSPTVDCAAGVEGAQPVAASCGVEGVYVDELGGGNVGVAESGADLFDVPPGGDERAGVRVPQRMEGRRRLDHGAVAHDGADASVSHGSAQDASGDVAVVVAGPGESGEHEVVRRAARGASKVKCFQSPMATCRRPTEGSRKPRRSGAFRCGASRSRTGDLLRAKRAEDAAARHARSRGRSHLTGMPGHGPNRVDLRLQSPAVRRFQMCFHAASSSVSDGRPVAGGWEAAADRLGPTVGLSRWRSGPRRSSRRSS